MWTLLKWSDQNFCQMGLGSAVHLESFRDQVWSVLVLARMPGEHVLYQLNC